MTRFIAVATVLAAALSAVLVVGCNLGTVPPNGGFLDSGTPGSADGGGDAGLGSCANPSTMNVSGNHNQGMACINTACHLAGSLGAGAPAFLIGGTLYTDTTGTMPAGGATVYIPDGSNTYTLVTANDTIGGSGNFYVEATGSATLITGGGAPEVSSCPSLWQTMPAPGLTAGSGSDTGGNCNRGGCHNTGEDDIGRIHL